jgi:hypothetical protein
MPDELFIINQGLEMRTGSSGKSRFTVRVVAEPIVISTDPMFLAMKPAQRMAEYLRQKVAGVATKAPEATLKYRQAALKAFIQGKAWAVERYSGGKMGSIPPARSENALNDSGRFAKSIRASQSKETGTWRIDVAANRLDPKTSGGFERVWNRIVSLVPELGQRIPGNIVAEGVKWSLENMIRKEKASSSKLSMSVARGLFDLARQAVSVVDEALTG